jgi:hypothetical protein
MHVKDTLFNLLKVLLKDKFPFKVENDVSKSLEQILNGSIDEWMWRRIIEKMYDPHDADELERRFVEQMEQREEVSDYICNGLSLGWSVFPPTEQITENKIQQFLS